MMFMIMWEGGRLGENRLAMVSLQRIDYVITPSAHDRPLAV